MVASGNVGLAFGLVAAAGAATTLGACVVFCASLAKPRFLAASLGFAAGVMLYVSFAEIFMKKSIDGFVSANYSEAEAYRYATLGFFGGFVVIFLLDRIVHFIIHRLEHKKKAAMANSQSRTVLLNAEDATEISPGARSPRSTEECECDVEAAKTAADLTTVATGTAVGCTSRCPPAVEVLGNPASKDSEESGGDEIAAEDSQTDEKKESQEAVCTSREAPAILEILENDPHNFALKKMGLLTALAIFIHNFPEGLLTFSATLADPSIGIGVCVAIALHNAPEGAVIALPIYYATGSKAKAFMWAVLSGLSEPLGALVGWAALSNGGDLSFAIVFALVGGMMVYISVKELIPMALRYDPKDTVATTAVIGGMALMAASLLLFTL